MSITAWRKSLSKLTRVSFGSAPAIAFLIASALFMVACGGSVSNGSKSVSSLPAPAITSAAPSLANEGDAYTYTIVATDPAATFELVSGPAGAVINGSTLTWTPTHTQSRLPNTFDIEAKSAAWRTVNTSAVDGTSAAGVVDQTFSVTPLGTIRGTAVDTYVTAEGNVAGSEDLTQTYIGAAVPQGSSWHTIAGIANSDGTFEIHGVPAGAYWFAAASGGYWTAASDIDLGQDFLGRRDGLVPTNPTYLALNISGLESEETEDSIKIFNPNLSQQFDLSDSINPGDTTVKSTWPWTGPLTDITRGDIWYANQVSIKDVGETSWRYLAKSTPPISITQADGSTTDFSGVFSDPNQRTVRLKTLGSQFAALAPAVGANAQIHSTTVGIYSQPFTASKGLIGAAQTLVESNNQDPITTDVDFGDVSFGTPFPANWTPFVALEYELTVPFTASKATTAVDVPAEMYISTTQLPSIDQPLVPVVSPVRNVKLNGVAFTETQGIAMLTPLLAWDAPSIGNATGYRVTVFQLLKAGSASNYQVLLDLFTKDTSVAMPDGILARGNEYFFAIRSYLAPTVDFLAAPYRGGLPWAHTDMLTAVVSTAGAPLLTGSNSSAMHHLVESATDQTRVRAGSANNPGLKALRPSTTAATSH